MVLLVKRLLGQDTGARAGEPMHVAHGRLDPRVSGEVADRQHLDTRRRHPGDEGVAQPVQLAAAASLAEADRALDLADDPAERGVRLVGDLARVLARECDGATRALRIPATQ